MKVAIVCGAPSSEFLAPYDDPEWQIWVLGNRLDRHLDKRVNRAFEVHDNLSEHADPEKYVEWLVSRGTPLIVGENFPAKGKHVSVFPYDAAEKLYGSTYLTSSPAYMVAIALLEGATHISIYGVDLSVDDHEYFWQRPCMEAWIGFAKGYGVNVSIPDVSHVGKCDYVEGKDWNGSRDFAKPPFTCMQFEAMAQEHAGKIEAKRAQVAQIHADIQAHNGAQQAYERLAKVARATEAGTTIDSLLETSLIR